MKTWQSVLFGITLGLLLSGAILLVARQPEGKPVTLNTPLPPRKILVHVSGAVKAPGVFALPKESRIQDAVLAAGGLTENADLDKINLAASITDGEKLNIPVMGASLDQTTQRTQDAPIPLTVTPSKAHPVNINTAPLSDLETLPGIGQSKAQQIILYRQEHGPFKSIEDIQKVPGIGSVTFERLKDLITVASTP